MKLELWMLADRASTLRDDIKANAEALGMTSYEWEEAFRHADYAYEAIRGAEDRLREQAAAHRNGEN
jgi:hypothetical protein